MNEVNPGFASHGGKNGTTSSRSIPVVVCGDLNSLPDSGVVDFLDNSRISTDHPDLKDLKYDGFLSRLANTKAGEKSGELTHSFKLRRACEEDHIPFTNLTYDFKGVIDYIYYSYDSVIPLGLLASVDTDYIKKNKILGFPHPHFPSDHQSLVVEFELLSSSLLYNPMYNNSLNSNSSNHFHR